MTSVLTLVTALAIIQWTDPSTAFLLPGALTYLVGCFLVTIVFNVPMNDALAALAPDAPDRAARWAGYLAEWTTWNHIRTAAALAASALLIIGPATNVEIILANGGGFPKLVGASATNPLKEIRRQLASSVKSYIDPFEPAVREDEVEAYK